MSYTTIKGKLVKTGESPTITRAAVKPAKKVLDNLRLIRTFTEGGKHYGLFHNNDDDARYLHDEDGDLILILDANLNVKARDGHFGDIHSEGDNWIFYYGPLRTRFDTGVTVNTARRSYCWEQLEAAEVAVCRHYVQRTLLPKFKRSQETEGGACD